MVTIEEFNLYQFELGKVIFPSTLQFLTMDEQGYPAPHGSGVLVNIDDHYFVFTAAHVLENFQDKLYVGIEKNEALQMGGEYIINRHSSREKDTLDVGIIKADSLTVEKLKCRYSFITKNELGIDHTCVNMPQYLALGYPVTKTKHNKVKNKFTSVPFIFITMPAKTGDYQKNDCNSEHQVLVHYDKKSVVSVNTRLKHHGPDSFGMSGCGFWNTTTQGYISKNNEKKLVAILTDWPNKNYWKGTRIDVFTEILRQKFNLDLPPSTVIKANIL